MRWTGWWLVVGAAMLAFASPAAADTFTVDGTGDGAGTCTGDSCPSIRAALAAADAAAGADTVAVPAGSYQLTQGALVVDSAVTLAGASARTTTIVGTGSDRVVDVQAGPATLSGLMLTGGHAPAADGGAGGDVRDSGAVVTLDHVRLTGGAATSGGGVANVGGTLVVDHSLVDHNGALDGSGDAGGIANLGGTSTPATLTVADSTVAFNAARLAGGIESAGSALNAATLERVTVADNTGGAGGAGGITSDATLSAHASIVAANTVAGVESNCGPGVVSTGANVSSAGDCPFTAPADLENAVVGLSPGLIDAGGQTDVLTFAAGSPALDRYACTATDQRDVPRPQGSMCDSGAVEAGTATPATPVITQPAADAVQQSASVVLAGTADAGDTLLVDESEGNRVASTTVAGDGSWRVELDGVAEGAHSYLVRDEDSGGGLSGAASRTVTVDHTAPAAPVIAAPAGGSVSDSGSVTVSGSAEDGATVTLYDGPAVVATTTAGGGSWARTVAFADGPHTLTATATDAAGNVSGPSAAVTFTVATPTPTPETAQPAPAATPPPVATEVALPQPAFERSVVMRALSGSVRVKLPGSTQFVAISARRTVALGSTVDVTHGRLQLTSLPSGTGTPQVANFYGGQFVLSQPGGVVQLTLDQALGTCRRKNKKTRQLWGDGHGLFRIQGRYSSATVRGTKWFVQDSCAGTLTRVDNGVVEVRDGVRHRTVLLRAGRHYLARPRK